MTKASSDKRRTPTAAGEAAGPRGRIQVTYRRIADLKPDPRNPRVHTGEQIDRLAKSIQKFGFNNPVLVDRDLNIVAGHGRILACQQLDWEEVPTICVEHLSKAQARAYMLADNRLAEIAVWNDRLLAENLKELSALDLDFDLETTGFSTAEIDLFIENLSPASDGAEDPADHLPAATGPAVSQPGDVLLLGRNRVCCGSALQEEAYEILLHGEKAKLVVTDPPYNLKIEGNVSGLGAVRHRDFAMASGEMSTAEYITFLIAVFSSFARHSVDGSLHYAFIDWRHVLEMLTAGRKVYTELKAICAWIKGNAGMGSFYRNQHEFICVFKHGRRSHLNNIQLGQYGRNRSNVWHYPGANSFSRGGDEGNLLALHPTVKPVALVADAILDCSKRGDIVLDGFLGSGTTIIAAERTGRRCFGIELDPLYVDTIVRRWQAFTGQHAHLESTGRSFDEVAAEAKEHHGV